MTRISKQTLISTMAALTLGGAMMATSAPAQAGYKYHHGGAIAAGVIGGLALGAMAASAYPAYGYGTYPVYVGRRCYTVRQPVFNSWGDVIYTRRVRVCD
jgi:biotin transporter BioY